MAEVKFLEFGQITVDASVASFSSLKKGYFTLFDLSGEKPCSFHKYVEAVPQTQEYFAVKMCCVADSFEILCLIVFFTDKEGR